MRGHRALQTSAAPRCCIVRRHRRPRRPAGAGQQKAAFPHAAALHRVGAGLRLGRRSRSILGVKKSHTPTARTGLPALQLSALAIALASTLAMAAPDPEASRFYEDALQRFEKRDMPGAIVQLKNALKADNKNLAVQVLLGKALLANGEVAAAEVAFNEALRLGVNRAEVVVPLARSLVGQARLAEVVILQRQLPAAQMQ